jgi:dihydroorotase-like cyclic amidohydrolase
MLQTVSDGLMTLNQWVRICCEGPARLFHLYPKKGCIQVGADADLIVVDMEREETIRDADIVSKCKWSPFDGRTFKGAPVMTLVRGNVVMEDGEVCAEAGLGEPVQRVGA